MMNLIFLKNPLFTVWVFITWCQIFGDNKCDQSVKRRILSSIKLFNDNSVILQGHSCHHCLAKWPTGIRPAAWSLFCLQSSHKGEKARQPSWVKLQTGAQRNAEEEQENIAIKQARKKGVWKHEIWRGRWFHSSVEVSSLGSRTSLSRSISLKYLLNIIQINCGNWRRREETS